MTGQSAICLRAVSFYVHLVLPLSCFLSAKYIIPSCAKKKEPSNGIRDGMYFSVLLSGLILHSIIYIIYYYVQVQYCLVF